MNYFPIEKKVNCKGGGISVLKREIIIDVTFFLFQIAKKKV